MLQSQTINKNCKEFLYMIYFLDILIKRVKKLVVVSLS